MRSGVNVTNRLPHWKENMEGSSVSFVYQLFNSSPRGMEGTWLDFAFGTGDLDGSRETGRQINLQAVEYWNLIIIAPCRSLSLPHTDLFLFPVCGLRLLRCLFHTAAFEDSMQRSPFAFSHFLFTPGCKHIFLQLVGSGTEGSVSGMVQAVCQPLAVSWPLYWD